MLLKEFYRRVILTEAPLAFLREHNLLDTVQEADPCHKCGSVMQEKGKCNRGGYFKPVLRCPRNGCQTTRSVHTGNQFFHYTDMNNKLHCNLSLCEILKLIIIFVLDIPMRTVTTLTGKSANTATDWFSMCREVCKSIISHQQRGKVVGTAENPIQIDEARFAGWRKYNRGRMLIGDNALLLRTMTQIKKATETMGIELMGLGFLVLNKVQTVRTFGWNGVIATLYSRLLKGNVHMIRLFIRMSGLLVAT